MQKETTARSGVFFLTLERECEACVFFYHVKDQTQAERRKHAGREGKKDVGLHFKQLLSLALCVVHMRSEREKRKKSSSHPQMATLSNANVKRTHMTARAPVKKSTAQGTRWIYRWLYVQGDDGEPITNVSVSSYFQGQNHLCVC